MVITGGLYNSGIATRAVKGFDTTTNRWLAQDKLPTLNVNRANHSSCTVGNTVAVVCGQDANGVALNSIELL